MKHIYLNLKRFDVPVEFGGVNRLAPVADWASCIVKNTQEELKTYDPSEVEFGMYFPEVHLLNAAAAKTEGSPVQIGCQSVACCTPSPETSRVMDGFSDFLVILSIFYPIF